MKIHKRANLTKMNKTNIEIIFEVSQFLKDAKPEAKHRNKFL